MSMTTWTFGTASATRTRKQRKAPKVGPGRDTQKSRVYDAEDLAQINLNGKCRRQTIANADLQAFVDKVLTKATVRRRWPSYGRPGGITARLKRGGSAYGKAGVREIMLPLFARNEWVILHEIAHVLHNHSHDEAPHGPEFVRIEMFLIEQTLGKDAAEAFKAACKEKRVKIAPAATTLPKPDTTVTPIKTGSSRTLARLEAQAAAAEKAYHQAKAAAAAARVAFMTANQDVLNYRREHLVAPAAKTARKAD